MLLVEQKNVRNPLFGHFPVKTEQTNTEQEISIVPEKKQTYFIIGSAPFHPVVALHAP